MEMILDGGRQWGTVKGRFRRVMIAGQAESGPSVLAAKGFLGFVLCLAARVGSAGFGDSRITLVRTQSLSNSAIIDSTDQISDRRAARLATCS